MPKLPTPPASVQQTSLQKLRHKPPGKPKNAKPPRRSTEPTQHPPLRQQPVVQGVGAVAGVPSAPQGEGRGPGEGLRGRLYVEGRRLGRLLGEGTAESVGHGVERGQLDLLHCIIGLVGISSGLSRPSRGLLSHQRARSRSATRTAFARKTWSIKILRPASQILVLSSFLFAFDHNDWLSLHRRRAATRRGSRCSRSQRCPSAEWLDTSPHKSVGAPSPLLPSP